MTDSKQTLDNMTVRRFAKLLKNNNKASSAPTLISGTVTKNDGETLISTENGDVSASLASANLNVGDSVMALCSNDEAVVIGNVTDKSACASELASTKDEVVSRMEKTEKKAGESLTVATEAKQTATEFSTTATSARKTAEEALTQSSSAVQTADKIQTTLTSDYSKTGEDATYATQTQLTQTSSDLTLKITNAKTDAKKVATNYLNFSSSGGLVVGDMTASTLGGNTQITSTGVNVRKGTTTLGSFTGDTITLGKTASGNNNTYINSSGVQIRNGTTALASFTSSNSTIGKTSSNNVVVDTSGMTVKNGSTALASFTADKITMGKTSGINAQVDSDSFDVCSGSTPYISMGYNSTSGAMISSLNSMPLMLSTACNINGNYTWSGKTRSGAISSWVERECSYGGWHITTYIKQAGQTYFYAELVYSGSGSGTILRAYYPGAFKLLTTYPNHVSVTTREENVTSSFAGHVEAGTSDLSFYPSNTIGASNATPFDVFLAGYFTGS